MAAKLSIVIPTFNAAACLTRCLESVVAQTYSGIEIVVVDGGSTDATPEIVARHALRARRLRWTSERDHGIYDAMNKGVQRSSGEWLLFMGADDALHAKDTIEQVAPALATEADFVHGNVVRMTTGRVEGGPVDRDSLFARNICQQAIFYRRDLLQRVGEFDLDFPICADWDLNIRCFAAGCRAAHLDLSVCAYAGTGVSASTTDHAFYERKLERIAAAYGVSFWHPLLRACRYDFHATAGVRWRERRAPAAAYHFALYLYHGAMAKLGA